MLAGDASLRTPAGTSPRGPAQNSKSGVKSLLLPRVSLKIFSKSNKYSIALLKGVCDGATSLRRRVVRMQQKGVKGSVSPRWGAWDPFTIFCGVCSPWRPYRSAASAPQCNGKCNRIPPCPARCVDSRSRGLSGSFHHPDGADVQMRTRYSCPPPFPPPP